MMELKLRFTQGINHVFGHGVAPSSERQNIVKASLPAARQGSNRIRKCLV
jgi:hypothetical protein